MVDMVIADQKASNPDQADANTNTALIQQMKPAMVESCAADHWSVELRTCIDSAADITASDGCKKYLTKAQEEGMGKRMAAVAAASAPPAQN